MAVRDRGRFSCLLQARKGSRNLRDGPFEIDRVSHSPRFDILFLSISIDQICSKQATLTIMCFEEA